MAKKRLEILTDVDRTAINKRIDDISTEYVFGFEETFVATANQVEFTLSKEFDKGMQAVDLYINGVKQSSSFFTEVNNKTIKTKKPIAQGDIVNIKAYKSKKTIEVEVIEHKDSHIGGNDQLPVATEDTKGLMAPEDKKKIKAIDMKADSALEKIAEHDTEVDNLKQSGVESNEILVDNLNSKGVIASTSDTIRVNVEKVKDIKMGTGNVKKNEVLTGKTYSSDEGTDLVGTMPNRGNLNKVILLDDYKDLKGKQTILNVPQGYYSGGKIEVERPLDDISGSPGNKIIQIGSKDEGYFGVVPASQLITGSALTSRVGVTQGTAQHSDTPWHKFAWKGKILFIAQKTIRYSISWDHLNSKNLIYGGKIIEINGIKYKVRLVRGALTDPSKYSYSDRGAKGSEWNRLVAPLSVQRKDNSWDYPAYMESDLQDWGTYISDSELVVRDVNGRRTWCQEVGGDSSACRVSRGGYGVSDSDTVTSSGSYSHSGWRPVLEVVE